MTDSDRKRVEEIREEVDGGGHDVKDCVRYIRELLVIIDRERVATSEDVERVAQAYCAAYLADPSEGFDRELAGARAALHAMGYTLQDEVKE